ncbi:putative HTH-type transcriptional regulator YybR [Nocardioides dokdonensis FR1436]|uniref:Putative HTH-type transcriptional regulator YybR n=1 Tax=Nocardioides dokdonensis FR1436 TaxID=1300347 RepID=A0A1A9GLW3_9ACTN|nr:putative HTH-type transcriptional regulator YybR [Nocardioides dokdonensis FR1436]
METTHPHTACDDASHRGDLYSAECPCRDILDLVASKWSALIIGRLEERAHRFGELRRAVPGITQKMLTQTLRGLEHDGLVDRTVLAHKRPPQVEYSLTDLGHTVTEPLAAMREWTERHLPDVRAARLRFDEPTPG